MSLSASVLGCHGRTQRASRKLVQPFLALQEAFQVLQRSGFDPRQSIEMLTKTLLATPVTPAFY